MSQMLNPDKQSKPARMYIQRLRIDGLDYGGNKAQVPCTALRRRTDHSFSDRRLGVDPVRDIAHSVSFPEPQPIACYSSQGVSLGVYWYLAAFREQLPVSSCRMAGRVHREVLCRYCAKRLEMSPILFWTGSLLTPIV